MEKNIAIYKHSGIVRKCNFFVRTLQCTEILFFIHFAYENIIKKNFPLPVPMALKTWCDETYCDQDCHKTINLNFIFLNKSKKVEKSLFLVLLKLTKCSFQPQKIEFWLNYILWKKKFYCSRKTFCICMFEIRRYQNLDIFCKRICLKFRFLRRPHQISQ